MKKPTPHLSIEIRNGKFIVRSANDPLKIEIYKTLDKALAEMRKRMIQECREVA